jgi:hypothetical protein
MNFEFLPPSLFRLCVVAVFLMGLSLGNVPDCDVDPVLITGQGLILAENYMATIDFGGCERISLAEP